MVKPTANIRNDKNILNGKSITYPAYKIIKDTRSNIVFIIIADTKLILEKLRNSVFKEKIFPGTVLFIEDTSYIGRIISDNSLLILYESFLNSLFKNKANIITAIFTNKILDIDKLLHTAKYNNIYNIYFNNKEKIYLNFINKIQERLVHTINIFFNRGAVCAWKINGHHINARCPQMERDCLENIINLILSDSGIYCPDKGRLPIRARQLYFLTSQCKKIDLDHTIFNPRGSQPEHGTQINFPFAWNTNLYDKNWFAQLHMWRMIDDYILEYEKNWDRQWLEQPLRIMLDWHSFYELNPPGPGVWETMNVGLRAMKIAYFLALHYSGKAEFSEIFIKCCLQMARSHMDFILKSNQEHLFNHTVMDMHGAMALSWVLPPTQSQKIFNYVDVMLDKLLDAQFDDQGIHKEHSPYYHLFGITCLKRLIHSGWFKKSRLETLVKKAQLASSWFFMPDETLAPIGDTPRNYPVCPAFDKKSALYASSGYAIVRKRNNEVPANDSYLFFMGSCNSKVHKHHDDLSLIWYEGEDILCDSGKFAYGSSLERAYVTSARAHNTLEIDGKGLQEYLEKPFKPWGNAIEKAERINNDYLISARVFLPTINLTYLRHVIFSPTNFLFIIDSIFSDKKHSFDFYWHFPANAKAVENGDNNIVLTLNSKRKTYISFSDDMPIQCKIVNGHRSPEMQGFLCDSMGHLIKADCLCLKLCNSKATFCTVFSLEQKIRLLKNPHHCYELHSGEKKYLIKIHDKNILFNNANNF